MSNDRRFENIRIVFHPASGKGKALNRANELAARLTTHRLGHTLVDTSRGTLAQSAERLAGADAVVIVGGDGLIHHVIQHVAGTGIPVGIIPAGSGNDTWRMLGDSNARESMDRIVHFLRHGMPARPVDLLEVRYTAEPEKPRLVIGAVSWGFEGTVNGRANTLPRPLGALRYLLALILSLPQLKAHECTIGTPETIFQGSAFVGSVANIKSLGGGFTLFPQANMDDGLADLAVVRGPRLIPVLTHVPQILTGRTHPAGLVRTAQKITVATEQPSYADGEHLGNGSFALRVLSGHLHLMHGADTR